MLKRIVKTILLATVLTLLFEAVIVCLEFAICIVLSNLSNSDIVWIKTRFPSMLWEALPTSLFCAMIATVWASISLRLEGRK